MPEWVVVVTCLEEITHCMPLPEPPEKYGGK